MRTIALLLACVALVSADEVTLKGGGKFSGIVEEKGDKVIVRMEHGSLTFDRTQIDKIDRTKSSVLQEYEERLRTINLSKLEEVEGLLKWVEGRRMAEPARELRERVGRLKWDAIDPTDPAQLETFAAWAKANALPNLEQVALHASLSSRRKRVDPKNAEALYQLGLWAKANGLAADALVLFQEAISLNPNHEFARRALGYQSFQGKWMTSNEVKTAMGLIEFEGDWMTPQAKEAVLVARTLEKERKLLEEARKKLEEERAKARAEADAQRRDLDARAAEIAAKLAELDRRQAQIVPAACGLGYPGCTVVGIHIHCSRTGCTLATAHFHCSKAGCAILTYHIH
jgi:tetratricopeptide (TPR) repeat protein